MRAVWAGLWMGMVPIATAGQTELHAPPLEQGTGYTCTSATGEVRRINVDLAGNRYQREGEAPYRIDRVNETSLILKEKNIVDLSDPATGPVSLGEVIDRRTLTLSAEVSIPERDLHRRRTFACVTGPIIDFTPGE